MRRTTKKSMLLQLFRQMPRGSSGATFLEECQQALFFNDSNPTGQRIIDPSTSVASDGLILASEIDEEYIPNVFDYIAYWKLDESAGTRQDSSTNNRDLSEDGGQVLNITGKQGLAAHTETDTRHLQWTGSNAFNFSSGSYTVMFWCKPNTTGSTQFHIIKSGGSFSVTAERGWRLTARMTPMAWNFIHYYSDQTTFVTHYLLDDTINDDLWFFIRFWRNTAANEHGFQINMGTKDLKALPAAQAMGVPNLNNFQLFRDLNSDSGGWRGAIDEVLLYNRYVTDAEASYIYNAGAGRQL